MPKKISNRGGYGRRPADWLVHPSIARRQGALEFERIAVLTDAPISAVRRLIEKYAPLINIAYEVRDGVAFGNVEPYRLRLLYDFLNADYDLRMQLRAADLKRPNYLKKAFFKFLECARKLGLYDDDDDEHEADEEETSAKRIDVYTIRQARSDIFREI